MTNSSLVVVSGFSGVGKGTVMKSLIERYDQYALSVSVTTRQPRENEETGKAYFFITDEEMEELIRTDGLVEHAGYCGHYYGTPKKFVEDKLAEGKDVILEIEMQGAMKIKEKYPDALLIFIIPPSGEALRDRLVGRDTESQEEIRKRLSRAKEEADCVGSYDYIFVNDVVEDCADRIHALVQSQRYAAKRNRALVEKICSEVRNFS